jgi:hypothetical protein
MSSRAVRSVLAAVAVTAACSAATACSDEDDLAQDEIPFEVPTLPPTTTLVIELLDVLGAEYCFVAEQVAPSIQVFTDQGADFGDSDVVRDTYVGTYVAFDALNQVSTREIIDQTGLLVRTMAEAVGAAANAGWDLTQVSEDALEGVASDDVAAALQTLRRYTIERCAIDIMNIEPLPTTSLYETPTQRLLRILEYTFPSLQEESLLCLGARLPLDWDPDDPELDEQVVLRAMARCGINPDAPSTPTTTTSTVPDTEP